MAYNKVLLVTDNQNLFRRFVILLEELEISEARFEYACTSIKMELVDEGLRRVNVKKEYEELIKKYDLILSLHCKQIFPTELVNSIKCINIHPGLNPVNRGWYPQVFSIIKKLPIGATIHEMDEEIDHGKIIAQKEVPVFGWDTSLDVYNRVLDAELELLQLHLIKILSGNYQAEAPVSEGNYNSIKDFEQLLEIDLNETIKVLDFIDRMRALTHGDFDNAYFVDPQTEKKVFVKIQLKQDA